ncbi:MAG: thymidine phosphorylase [Nanoarchaeota archaeon]|nr:thymidine phosphorylase [Nanoarchaeota archaeon]
MELRIKLLKWWSTGFPVAILNEKTAEEIGVRPSDRISIRTFSTRPTEITTIIDTAKGVVRKNEIAVSHELKQRLGLKSGQKVNINLAESPKSLESIKKKLNKKTLSEKEILEIIDDVVNNSLAESEIALFISAMHKNGMNLEEITFLIKAILKTGNKLKLKDKFVIDKHSIGGVAGNRTTPIVVSICAAAGGLVFPKTSSRAITSAAGTADVIEMIANVEFSIKQIKKILKKTKACMVWGGALGMVPADSKIIRIEKSLGIDPQSQLLASIMAKKLAVGSKYILIDIPYGKSAKANKQQAIQLKHKFEKLGKFFKVKLKCILTDGSQPIGNGVGPALELTDVIKVLKNEQGLPKDLEKKSLFLAGEIFEMIGKSKKGKGIQLAKEILSSGKAFEKFKKIIEAQGGDLNRIKLAKLSHVVVSKKSGKIKEIDNKKINFLARITGCPLDKSAGLFIHSHVNEKVKKGKPLLTIYSESEQRLNQAVKFYQDKKPIKI